MCLVRCGLTRYHPGEVISVAWEERGSGGCVGDFVDVELCAYQSGGGDVCYGFNSGVTNVAS